MNDLQNLLDLVDTLQDQGSLTEWGAQELKDKISTLDYSHLYHLFQHERKEKSEKIDEMLAEINKLTSASGLKAKSSPMVIRHLFGQRKEHYEGQYAPELLASVDEFTDEESPEWFERECANEIARNKKDFLAFKVVNIEIDVAKLRSLLMNVATLEGKIREE